MSIRSKTIEFLASTKLGKKGQITVPKRFREDLGIGIGARVDVLRVGNALVILREELAQKFRPMASAPAAAAATASSGRVIPQNLIRVRGIAGDAMSGLAGHQTGWMRAGPWRCCTGRACPASMRRKSGGTDPRTTHAG